MPALVLPPNAVAVGAARQEYPALDADRYSV
jgi:hypothetical protein